MVINSPPDTVPIVADGHARTLYIRGLAASAVYILGLLIYSVFEWGHMLAMKPDEFATFLSGVFAPLAFLWLVLGFRQQGDELQNSARALWLQGEELRNSVEQQRQLVEVSREQLASELADRLRSEDEAERAAQPQLLIPGIGGTFMGPERYFDLVVSSGGPACSNVTMNINEKVVRRLTFLPEGGRIDHTIRYMTSEEVEPLELSIDYVDLRGNARRQRFHVSVDETGGPANTRALGEAGPVGPPISR